MRVIYTAGVFDQLHEGHLNILRRSKALGDVLLVGVVTDIGAASYKPDPPLWSEHHRLAVVTALEFVDGVFLQPGTDPSPVLLTLAAVGVVPEIMTHGDDWGGLLEGQETLDRLGIELRLIPHTPGISTSLIRERIAEREQLRMVAS